MVIAVAKKMMMARLVVIVMEHAVMEVVIMLRDRCH